MGKTWGYDDKGVWVADGCVADFLVRAAGTVVPEEAKKKTPRYVPNGGFLLFDGDEGQMYARLFTYVRYLNQLGLNETYTDSFGNVKSVTAAPGLPAAEVLPAVQRLVPHAEAPLLPLCLVGEHVAGRSGAGGWGGNISYVFNRYVTLGGGITSLPSVRSTEGQFPYWLGVDDRLIADEFFRGSYTTGLWLKGEFKTKFKYMAMLANNLSTLGVSASQIDNTLDTQSYMLMWLPTTGEFGLYGTFGDYDYHDKLATRLAVHYTSSTEDKQSQPGADGIENSQIRLTDGSIIFTPNLFGDGITVNRVKYRMSSMDGGLKYKGLSFEAEYYWRWLSNYEGANVSGIPDIDDHGYQIQASAMPIPKLLQVYFGNSGVYGKYGNPWEYRFGTSVYPVKQRGFRVNAEVIHINHSPVGYTAYPMPVGATGNVFHVNWEMNF